VHNTIYYNVIVVVQYISGADYLTHINTHDVYRTPLYPVPGRKLKTLFGGKKQKRPTMEKYLKNNNNAVKRTAAVEISTTTFFVPI